MKSRLLLPKSLPYCYNPALDWIASSRGAHCIAFMIGVQCTSKSYRASVAYSASSLVMMKQVSRVLMKHSVNVSFELRQKFSNTHQRHVTQQIETLRGTNADFAGDAAGTAVIF